MASFYSVEELQELGFKRLGGRDILISRNACFYGTNNMVIENHVRIDDFCILSGVIKLGSYIHISAGVMMFGGSTGIEIQDFSGVSSRSIIYAESDDYSGAAMINPMVPFEYRNVQKGKVLLEKHVQIGAACVVLPGVTFPTGSAVGSMSFVNKSLEPWGLYAGIPCKKIKERSQNVLELEAKMMSELKNK